MDWKTRILLITGAIGAVAGVMAGLLYIREIEESGAEAPPKLSAGSAFSIGMTTLGVIRQVASLGRPRE